MRQKRYNTDEKVLSLNDEEFHEMKITDIINALCLLGAISIVFVSIYSRNLKADKRFMIPLGIFSTLVFLCKLIQGHPLTNHQFLKFLVYHYEPLFAGSAIGIGIVAIATGGCDVTSGI